MKQLLIVVLFVGIALPSVMASGCASKDKAAITSEKKADFGTANQPMSDSARAGMAAMMAKHGNPGGPPPPAQVKPPTTQ